MVKRDIKKYLVYLICLVLIIVQTGFAAFASGDISVSDINEEGLVTISGNISSGAGKPVAILVVNTSVDAGADRLGGIRMSDSCVSGENGAYSFNLRPTDGGVYKVSINGNNGAEKLDTTFNVLKPVVMIGDSIDAPGDDSCIQVSLSKGGNIDNLEITLSYDANVFAVSGKKAINPSEYFTVVSSQVSETGKITCNLKKKTQLPTDEFSVCLVDLSVKSTAEYNDYTVSVTAKAKDKFGSQTGVDTENGTFKIQAVSPKTEARNAALSALKLVKNTENITYDNYASELAAVKDAREKLDYALSLNIKKTDFANYIDALEQAEAKLLELKAGFDALALLNGANSETIDGVLEENKEFFGVTEEMLEIYELLEAPEKVRNEIVEKSFATPVVLEKVFTEKLALEALSQLNWPNMEDIISALNSVLELDVEGDFAELSENEQAEVYRIIAKNEYASIEDIKDSFVDAVEEVQNSDSKSSKGSGGGGGGGGGSVVVSGVTSAPIPNNEIPSDYTKDFVDTKDIEWAKDAISYLSEKGIINGKSDGIFAPNDTIKREEFVKIIVCALGIYDENATCDFKDAKADEWYSAYIGSAVAKGIISGVGENMFGVGENISRQDMAVIICRAYGIAQGDIKTENSAFDDWSDVADYAKTSISAMVEKGVINGISEKELAPKAFATRAQAAVMIYKVMQNENN